MLITVWCGQERHDGVLPSTECGIKVAHQIVVVLDTDRNPHQTIGDAVARTCKGVEACVIRAGSEIRLSTPAPDKIKSTARRHPRRQGIKRQEWDKRSNPRLAAPRLMSTILRVNNTASGCHELLADHRAGAAAIPQITDSNAGDRRRPRRAKLCRAATREAQLLYLRRLPRHRSRKSSDGRLSAKTASCSS